VKEDVDEALKEGVLIDYNVSVLEILGNGREVTGVRCQRVKNVTFEPDGKISVIKKKEKQPVTPETLQVLTLNRLDALMVQGMHRTWARADDMFKEVWRRSRPRVPP
jgi:uncharacterized membrane protein YcaP (DUF421 family)